MVVVVVALSQHQSPLAVGNIIGSSISNILGAFSLGLIFSPDAIAFDRSSKIYTAVLLALTTYFVIFLSFFQGLGRFGGLLLVVTFVVYVVSIAWAIYKGIVVAPEDSDSDSDSDSDASDSDSDSSDSEDGKTTKDVEKLRHHPKASPSHHLRSLSSSSTTLREASPSQDPSLEKEPTAAEEAKAGPLLTRELFDEVDLTYSSPLKTMTACSPGRKAPHSTLYHLAHLTFGFLALSLSGYVLSHSVSTLAESFALSGTVLGATFLSFATTLPEKLVSVMSGSREQHGVMVANTAGSNIFLLTLCAGVLFLFGDLEVLKGSVSLFEVGAMWASSVILFGIVMGGGRRWMGWVMLAGYVAFIVMEFTADRR